MSLSFPRHILKRAFQLVALFVAGLVVAVLVGIYAENREHMPSGRWLGWAGYTVLLAFFVIRDHRATWRRRSLWLTLAGLFLIHTTLYAIVFRSVETWRGIWFLP